MRFEYKYTRIQINFIVYLPQINSCYTGNTVNENDPDYLSDHYPIAIDFVYTGEEGL